MMNEVHQHAMLWHVSGVKYKDRLLNDSTWQNS